MLRVIVKGAAAGPVAAVLFEGDASGLDQADEVGVGFESGDVGVGDAHGGGCSRMLGKSGGRVSGESTLAMWVRRYAAAIGAGSIKTGVRPMPVAKSAWIKPANRARRVPQPVLALNWIGFHIFARRDSPAPCAESPDRD